MLVALFCAFVGLSTEANARAEAEAVCPSVIENEVLRVGDNSDDLHLAIESNSRFVAPPLVARVTGAAVRIISTRTQSNGDQIAPEHRARLLFSSHNIRAVNEVRLLRLSPSQLRTRYIYSLRRIVI